MKSIAIIGPEASGKTELARYLAERFGGIATEEYARLYFAERDLPADYVLSIEEMRDVMAGQRALEQGEGLRLIDASTIHGPLYAGMHRRNSALVFDLAAVDGEVLRYATEGAYDAFLLCMPHESLGWVDDGLRAMPELADRHAFAEACADFVMRYYQGKPVLRVDEATWRAREAQAVQALEEWTGYDR